MGRVRKPRPVVGMRPLWEELSRNRVSSSDEELDVDGTTPTAILHGRQGTLFDLAKIETVRRVVRPTGRPRVYGTSGINGFSATSKWRARNVEKYRAQSRDKSAKVYARRMAWLKQLKEQAGCAVCGETFFASLDFHHIDRTTKTGQVGGATVTRSKQWLYAEMRKCVLLCKNCHYKVEHGALDISHIPPFDPESVGFVEDAA